MIQSIIAKTVSVIFLMLAGFVCQAQKTVEPDLSALFRANKLTTVNRTASIINIADRKNVLHLDAKENAGIIWVNDIQFSEGTIEFDVKGKNILQKSFVGIAFHGTNDSTYDAVYFRPFNFKSSEKERRDHSVQYISLPKFDWPVLRKDSTGIYEKPINPSPEPEEWLHARVIIENQTVKVFVNQNEEPSLVVKRLSNQNAGKVGFWVGHYSEGDFAGLKISSK
jgi:hypothetical protein